MDFHTGARSEGQWVNGKLNGKAKMRYPNGDIYEGEWVENLKCGFGSYTMCNGQ